MQELERTNLELEWSLGNLQMNYAGGYTKQSLVREEAGDSGDAFDAAADPNGIFSDFGQHLETNTKGYSHEVRFSSVDPLFNGLLDYVVGGLYQYNDSPSEIENPTPVILGGGGLIAQTPIERLGDSTEKSIFGNLTFHLTDDTELSGGMRHIQYETDSELIVSGRTLSESNESWSTNIYSLSLKHHLTEDMMIYASYGSSWRPGIEAVGDFSSVQTPLEQSFLNLDPETSDSYEVGMKSSWLDNRLRLNVTAFYQEFDNFPYRAGGPGVYYVSTDAATGDESVKEFNFVAAVPVEVYGIELESAYQISENWDANALFSWSKGEIQDGTIPCNDYSPRDGQPDASGVPTINDIRTATGGDNLSACQTDIRSNYTPLWSATFQSEYQFPVAGLEGYVRGLWTLYGDSENDPTNSVDDVDSYNILNLFAGVRDPEGKWEVMVYGKNIADTERVLSRDANPSSTTATAISFGPGGVVRTPTPYVSDYRSITMTAPREFGVNFRYNF